MLKNLFDESTSGSGVLPWAALLLFIAVGTFLSVVLSLVFNVHPS